MTTSHTPDLIIAGSEAVAIPAVNSQIESPFFIEGVSQLATFKSDGQAFSIGLINMLYAFEHITLGSIYWPRVLSEALNLSLTNK